MRNPFRTEAEAFRFVWLTIIYFALIVIGSVIDKWLGLGIFIGQTAVIVAWWVLTRSKSEDTGPQAPPENNDGQHRILVIANETVGGESLLSALKERSQNVNERVMVVTPALNTPLRHWVSDEDRARQDAQKRLDESLAAMRAAGIEASGDIGDADPVLAIEDAMRTFPPNELIISTHPEGRSNWLERGVVEKVRARYSLPVTHVVVDLEAEGKSSEPAGASEPTG